jgi:DivIVA domain-containing protein
VDRDEIERRDFPAARRGYDAGAVHEHLRRVADELEALAARPHRASVAEGTSTQVRAILEAAESSAQQLRDDAGREASDHVERVGDAAQDLLGTIDRLQGELDRLMGALRSSAESLTGSLEELSREVGTLRPPVEGDPVEPAAVEPPAADAEPPAPARAANGARSDDEAGARLVALNMALEDAPREETARYLGEHFELADVERLLDDVYASAGR